MNTTLDIAVLAASIARYNNLFEGFYFTSFAEFDWRKYSSLRVCSYEAVWKVGRVNEQKLGTIKAGWKCWLQLSAKPIDQ